MNRILPVVALALALACGAAPSGVAEVSQDDLLSGRSATLILDVRTPAEYAAGHVPDAVSIPHDQLAARLAEIEAFRDEPIVLYCESGGRAGRAASILADAGFTKLLHLEGDMSAWRKRGLPTEPAGAVPSQ